MAELHLDMASRWLFNFFFDEIPFFVCPEARIHYGHNHGAMSGLQVWPDYSSAQPHRAAESPFPMAQDHSSLGGPGRWPGHSTAGLMLGGQFSGRRLKSPGLASICLWENLS